MAPAARKRDAKLSFAFVYPDKNGRFIVRPVCFLNNLGFVFLVSMCSVGQWSSCSPMLKKTSDVFFFFPVMLGWFIGN